ncbi:pyridoxamine 5'-phosphate oxidase family protein [Desulfovibrio sp. OttesenSCG-928-C06]|nr:pyridoxamine 5'-phosphate oxidase family protein [Desulfovibrio sp. OttesenSCG-928-C06]
MNHPIRRKDRSLDTEATLKLLEACEYGTLCTVDAQGQPYCMPLSYIFMDGVIYFHSAMQGHKIDNLKYSPKTCFSVVGPTQPIYDNGFTTYYSSAVVFGETLEVTDPDQKTAALRALSQKYLPGDMDKADGDIARSLKRTAVYAIKPEQITGKAKQKK